MNNLTPEQFVCQVEFPAGDTLQHLRWVNPNELPSEVRMLGRAGGVISRVFGCNADAAAYIHARSGPTHNIFFTINPVALALVGGNKAASDKDVTRRQTLPFDIDPERKAKTNATDAEKETARLLAGEVWQYLKDRGFPDPLELDSGNGFHGEYAIDLAADDNRVERLLKAMKRRFQNDAANIDTTVFNPSRIMKVAGVHTGKGESTAERPDRVSRLLVCPERVVVTAEIIDAVLLELEAPAPPPVHATRGGAVSVVPAVATVGAATVAGGTDENPHAIADTPAELLTRVARYVATMGVPISGEKGDPHTFRILASLLYGFALPRAVVLDVFMREVNLKLLEMERHDLNESWTRAAIERKVDRLIARGPKSEHGPVGRLRDAAPARKPFPTHLLPPAVADFVRNVAASIGCPEEFVALPSLSVMAGAIGAKYVVQLKKGWFEVCVLWTLIVAASGAKKSPAFSLATAPARKIAAEQAALFKKLLTAYHTESVEWKKTPISKREDPPERPTLRKWLLSDATVEAVADRLDGHPEGLLLIRDEMDAFFTGFNQYKNGGGSDRASWLEMHSGGTVNVDRKNADRPSIFIDRVCVSMCGGIQPAVFAVSATASDFASGLIPRFLPADLSGVSGMSGWVDAEVSENVTRGWEVVVRALYSLPTLHNHPSVTSDLAFLPHRVELCPTARQLFIDHANDIAKRMAGASAEMRAALSKLEGAAARLALVIHLVTAPTTARGEVPPVTEEAMRAGVELAQWFAGEAFTLYGNRGDKETLASRLLKSDGEVSCRDLQRANSRVYPNRTAAAADLAALVGYGVAVWADDSRSKILKTPSGTAPDTARRARHPAVPESAATS